MSVASYANGRRTFNTYIIGTAEGEPVKVGRTKDLRGRMSSLQTSNSKQLVLFCSHCGDIESETKELIGRQNRLKGEWFAWCDSLVGVMGSPGWHYFRQHVKPSAGAAAARAERKRNTAKRNRHMKRVEKASNDLGTRREHRALSAICEMNLCTEQSRELLTLWREAESAVAAGELLEATRIRDRFVSICGIGLGDIS
jgi:hypothetical protein